MASTTKLSNVRGNARAASGRTRAVRVFCTAHGAQQSKSLMQKAQLAAASAGLVAALLASPAPSWADLNVLEAEAGGEFGRGSAMQFGEADVDGRDFSNQDLRRSNFTSASCKRTNFKGAKLEGAYFIKAVVPWANFEGANLSDVLMDRAVMNNANLKDAVLQRAIFTRSDLGGANIEGADFTNALLDKPQQMALCKYADGVNPVTGVSTRRSLGCGSMRKFRASTPSNPDGPQVNEEEKEAFLATQAVYRQ